MEANLGISYVLVLRSSGGDSKQRTVKVDARDDFQCTRTDNVTG